MKNIFNRGSLSFIALLLCLMTMVNAKVATAGWDKMTTGCKEKLFPVTSGGSKDEQVSCTFHDKVNDLIIVAGNSTSENYAPAPTDHAFAYALDMDGNWVWGKFFYNVSFAVSTISGCTFDANGNVVFLGMGNSVPVIMEVAPKDGEILKYMSLDKIGSTDATMPWYTTYGAIYHDTNDNDDGQSYYYTSFIMEDSLQMLKINSATKEIKWNYEQKYEGDTTNNYWKQKKIPGFLHQDPKDNTRMYLLGQQSQRASVIKFQKRDMKIDWKLEITDPNATSTTLLTSPASAMNEIYGYVQPSGSNQIYACGYSWDNPLLEKTRTASMFQMDEEGEVRFLYAFGEKKQGQNDACRAVAYDDVNDEILFALEVTSPSLRPAFNDYAKYSAANTDVTIIRMKPGGKLVGAHNINFYDASISIGIGANALFTKDGEYIFGTQSSGFYTKYQNQTYEGTAVYGQLDTNVFRYTPGSSECFYQASMNAAQIQNAVVNKYQASQIADKTRTNTGFQKIQGLFLAYNSRYSGSFDLGQTMKYPKMCAASSLNLTVGGDGVQYYRGQNAARNGFQINKVPGAPAAAAQMDNGQTFMFDNGTAATGLIGRWDAQQAGGTIFIHTDSEEAVGTSRTILRGCSNFDDLLELYLWVNVIKNSYPDFVKEIETSWTLRVGEVFEYKLPALKDDEGNDEPELYVAKYEGWAYPPFLFFNNDTNTLKFTPHSIQYQGMTYYFKIVVKEKHSDSNFYPYYCTVKMAGRKVDPQVYIQPLYKKAVEDAKRFISLTKPFKCDPLSSDRDFCSRTIKSVDACCMEFQYVGNKTRTDQYRNFDIRQGEWLESQISNLTGSLPIKPGMAPVYLCSSESLLRATNSVYVSNFKPERPSNARYGYYKIGGVVDGVGSLLPGLKGQAKCMVTAFSGAEILKVTLGCITLAYAVMLN